MALFLFAGVKYGFYALGAAWLNSWYQSKVDVWVFALVRVVLGLVLGLSLLLAVQRFGGWLESTSTLLVLGGRVAQWLALLVFFYDRRLAHPTKTIATACMGAVYSTLLDLPAAFVGLATRVLPIC